MSNDLTEKYRARVEKAMEGWLPSPDKTPAALHQAMRYAALAKGKRLRPALVYATGEALGVPADALDAPACAAELVHAYSLVHDDLPAMDNDSLRRGQPTCHIVYGESLAILAGDALQSLAFAIICQDHRIRCTSAQRLSMIKILADAIGSTGMAGGQAIDLDAEGKQVSTDELDDMHRRKTGCLITASVQLGALSKEGVSESMMRELSRFGQKLGLAFQIQDDILDVEGDTKLMGKLQGADVLRRKSTYPSILGMHVAKRRARELFEEACSHLQILGSAAGPLRSLAEFVINRTH